jgi:hypothetical protein
MYGGLMLANAISDRADSHSVGEHPGFQGRSAHRTGIGLIRYRTREQPARQQRGDYRSESSDQKPHTVPVVEVPPNVA